MWGCLDFFSLVYHFFFLTPSLWETARYRLKYCLKGPLSPNQPTKCCVSSLEAPHPVILIVHTIYHFQDKRKKITLNHSNSAAMGFSSKGLKNEFEIAMVNEQSVFKPLKVFCISFLAHTIEKVTLFLQKIRQHPYKVRHSLAKNRI